MPFTNGGVSLFRLELYLYLGCRLAYRSFLFPGPFLYSAVEPLLFLPLGLHSSIHQKTFSKGHVIEVPYFLNPE
jgi:hypothetical protein